MTDSTITMLYTATKIRTLHIYYCQNVTKGIYADKPCNVSLNVYGCWKINEPDTSLTPMSVVDFQMNALNHINEAGYEKFLSFVSDNHRLVVLKDFNGLGETVFQEFVSQTRFSKRYLYLTNHNSIVCIRTPSNKCYHWLMC